MSIKEYEAANIIFPLKNTPQMTAQHRVLAGTAPSIVFLPSIFGPSWHKHYYTVDADGAKLYVAMSHETAQPTNLALRINQGVPTSNPTGVAYYPGVSYPIPDGQYRSFAPQQGARMVGTSVATTLLLGALHYQTVSGTASGFMNITRSSLGPGQDPGHEFRPLLTQPVATIITA